METADHRYVLKKTEHVLYNQWLSEECQALQYLRYSGLPVPKVHYYHADQRSVWLLMDAIEGVSLREFLSGMPDPKLKEKAIASFGRMLKQIHTTPCPAELLNDTRPWLDTMLAKAENNLNHFDVHGSAELLDELKANTPQPIDPTLIHGDFTLDNVLVRDGDVVGVIDWAGAAYGDRRYDIALAIRPKPNAFEDRTDRDIFFEAYGPRSLAEEDYLYFKNGLYCFF